eukprot:2271281-Amphidinium_carterae.1
MICCHFVRCGVSQFRPLLRSLHPILKAFAAVLPADAVTIKSAWYMSSSTWTATCVPHLASIYMDNLWRGWLKSMYTCRTGRPHHRELFCAYAQSPTASLNYLRSPARLEQ